MRASPSRTARVRLPASTSVGMSRRLLATRIAQARAPTPTAGEPGARPGRAADLDVRRADHRDEAEEDEDHHLAQAEVAVGTRPAGVEPGRGHAQRAHDQQPPRRQGGQHQAGHRGHPEGGERGGAAPRPGGGAGADEPHRADPVVVGAADAVGVVVGVVDAHLQRQRDHRASSAFHRTTAPSASAATPMPASTGASAAGRVRGRAPATHCAGVATRAILQAPRPGRDVDPGGLGESWPASTSVEPAERGPARPGCVADGPTSPSRCVVETSGSTGTAQAGGARPSRGAGLGARHPAAARRAGPWVLALPAAYVAGLQVRVRSLVAGHGRCCRPGAGRRGAAPAGHRG